MQTSNSSHSPPSQSLRDQLKARWHAFLEKAIRLLGARAFRMVLTYVVVLGVSVSLLLTALFAVMYYKVREQQKDQHQQIITNLTTLALRTPPRRFAHLVTATSRQIATDGILLILIDPFGKHVAGTEGFTYTAKSKGKFVRYEIVLDSKRLSSELEDKEDDPNTHTSDNATKDKTHTERDLQFWKTSPPRHIRSLKFKAEAIRLPLKGTLLIAQTDITTRIMSFAFKSVLVVILLMTLGIGTTGGIILSRRILRQIDAINQTVDSVLDGDFLGRVKTTGSGDEFDKLANNLNVMLDRTQTLIDDIRSVTDNIAHDLRTPLTRLHTTLATVQSQNDGAAAQKLLEQAVEETNTLIAIFNALLRISELERGRRELTMESCDLGAALFDLEELYRPLAEENEQAIQLDCPSTLIVFGERQLLIQAFSNILDNALKYAGRGSTLLIRAAKDFETQKSEKVRIEISDNGPGVSNKELIHLTDRFQRGDKARTSRGYGLGLALVKAIVARHGGSLEITPARPHVPEIFQNPASEKEAVALSKDGQEEDLKGDGLRFVITIASPTTSPSPTNTHQV